jgi:hypothetical protein
LLQLYQTRVGLPAALWSQGTNFVGRSFRRSRMQEPERRLHTKLRWVGRPAESTSTRRWTSPWLYPHQVRAKP